MSDAVPCPCGTRRVSGRCKKKCKAGFPWKERGRVITLDTPAKTAAGLAGAPAPSNRAPRQFTGTMFKVIPEEDPKYLAWIRTLPCIVPGCGCKGEAHHQNPEHDATMSGKCSDRRAIPLCWHHHTGGGTKTRPGSYHGQARAGGETGRAFLAQYRIDPEKIIKRLNEQYDRMKGVRT